MARPATRRVRTIFARVLVSALLCVGNVRGQQPLGRMEAGDATVRGAVLLTGTTATVLSGAQIVAGAQAATVRLERGGELKICPRTAATITASASGKEQLIALSAGAVEAHYRLGSNSDAILTPDFRLQLSGPGEFELAVGIVARGGACIVALPGSTAAVIVSEVMGEGTHQVRPGEGVVFHDGSVATAETAAPGSCGCPAPAAQNSPAELGFPEEQSRAAAAAIAAGRTVSEPLPLAGVAAPVTPSSETRVKIDAPMIFRGARTPMPTRERALVARANLAPAWFPPMNIPEVQPPPKAQKRNWLRRFGAKLAGIFR